MPNVHVIYTFISFIGSEGLSVTHRRLTKASHSNQEVFRFRALLKVIKMLEVFAEVGLQSRVDSFSFSISYLLRNENSHTGKHLKSWRRRWTVLTQNYLLTFRTDSKSKPPTTWTKVSTMQADEFYEYKV